MKTIPLSKPWFSNKELKEVEEVILSGKIKAPGPKTKKLKKQIQKIMGIKHVFLTDSCTAALEISTTTLNLKSEDEVICPSYTFVSTISSIIKAGAIPKFVDINPETLGLDPKKVNQAITKKTKAIILVHYGGISASVHEIKKICVQNQMPLIEDAAQVLFSKDNGQYLGTIGEIGCFSFHATKNFTCGEGGMLVTNRDDLKENIEELKNFGTNRKAFQRNEVSKYSWQRLGRASFMGEIQAAVLFRQILARKEIIQKRKELVTCYTKKLEKLEKKGVSLAKHHKGSNFHLFWLITRSQKERKKLLKFLGDKGIKAAFHYLPLHQSPYLNKNPHLFRVHQHLTVTNEISSRILRLPLYPGLSLTKVKQISDYILDFYKND